MTQGPNQEQTPPAARIDESGPGAALPAELEASLDSLDSLDELAVSEHIDRYQSIHSGLQDVLSGIEGV